MAEKICLFTDSSSDLSRNEALEYDVAVLPHMISYDQQVIREHYDITPEEYWKLLGTCEEIPTTAQVSLVDFEALFTKAREDGCEKMLGIMINAKGSGSYSTACIARELFYEKNGGGMEIVLLDSTTYSYLYGHIVVACAKMRKEGKSFAEIVAAAERRIAAIRCHLGVYSLKHLRKSGRISGGAAFVGEALGLRPIAVVTGGAVTLVDKVRGDKNVLTALIDKAKKEAYDPKNQVIGILYADMNPTEIDRLEELIWHELAPSGVERHPIGPAVVTNTGPLALAIYFYDRSV